MVCPSPFWRTTSEVPMVPAPPVLVSTIADWPHAACRWAASIRPITSVLPPAAAGTMRRTVSVGRQSAAWPKRGNAAVAENAAAADNTLRRESLLVTFHSLLRLLFCGKRRECTGGRQADGLAPARDPSAQRVPRMLRSASQLRRGALLIRGPAVIVFAGGSRLCGASLRAAPRPEHDMQLALVEAEQLEQPRQVAELLARGRRGAADEVEDPALLHP